MQFECIRKPIEMTGINVHTTVRDKHVPEIERCIRTVKVRMRVPNTLVSEKLPHQLILEIAYKAVFWLNGFLHKNGINTTLCPRTIVTRCKINNNKH